ncbi:MAG: hypothetical protein AAF252_04385 [Pseudomonadota bacterium]
MMRYAAIGALVVALGLGGLLALKQGRVASLQAENASLQAENASLTRSVVVLENTKAQALSAERLAWQEIIRRAEANRSLKLQLAAYLEGDCDATDPACAVDYINSILRAATATD